MNVKEILEKITKEAASDLFIVAGRPLTYKCHGKMMTYSDETMTPTMCHDFVSQIYELAGNRDLDPFEKTGDDDFSFALAGVSRFRVSTYKQRGSYSAVIRIITFDLPRPEDLQIPQTVMNLADTNDGMILITGPAGSGKSTTLACLIDKINSEQEKHIITLEDPLEYLHSHKKCIVSQREICTDTENYLTALRASLRQSPDVILLGEMRDYETINTAMSAAETGHLVFSTLHTVGAANTIDRIIDAFPASQQAQIAVQLPMVLRAVISQRLIPTVNGDLVPAFEIMILNPAIRTLIRERKTHQIDSMIQTNMAEGMITMDTSILNLYKQGIIDKQAALANASNPDMLEKKLI